VPLWGQVLFSSLQGFYSMDCILDHNSSVPIAIQRVLVALLQPILLLLFSALFWLGWCGCFPSQNGFKCACATCYSVQEPYQPGRPTNGQAGN
jgi:hypothetical protein